MLVFTLAVAILVSLLTTVSAPSPSYVYVTVVLLNAFTSLLVLANVIVGVAFAILIVYVASFVTPELLSATLITYVYVPAGVFATIVIVVPDKLI